MAEGNGWSTLIALGLVAGLTFGGLTATAETANVGSASAVANQAGDTARAVAAANDERIEVPLDQERVDLTIELGYHVQAEVSEGCYEGSDTICDAIAVTDLEVPRFAPRPVEATAFCSKGIPDCSETARNSYAELRSGTLALSGTVEPGLLEPAEVPFTACALAETREDQDGDGQFSDEEPLAADEDCDDKTVTVVRCQPTPIGGLCPADFV